MRKRLIATDENSGEVLFDKEFDGDFLVQYVSDTGHIAQKGRIDNAKFGEKHEVKNFLYVPIAEKLIARFDELAHIDVVAERILYLENIHWEPPPGETRKKTWIARIKKADAYLKSAWKYDYVMEIKGHYAEQMSKEQIIALIYHELRHIGQDGDIYPHDVEDWGNMVATLGSNWATTRAEIIDLLDHEFDGWDELRVAGRQLSLFQRQPVDQAAATTIGG